MSTCPASTDALFPSPLSDGSERYIVSSPTRAAVTSFVTRDGSRLFADGMTWRAVGANVYWLGIDENDPPGSVVWPSKQRVLDAFATIALMGGTAVRSTTLGVSIGCTKCLMPELGKFNEEAFEVFDFAVYAAKMYDIRLIIPLIDQYDYFHGGIKTFLRWRGGDEEDFNRFYDINGEIFGDWKNYVQGIVGRVSSITGTKTSEEPAVLAWELGNELGGWSGRDYPPPKEWTQATAQFLRNLTSQQFIMSGSYGLLTDELDIPEIDFVTNHFYPMYSGDMSSDASKAAAAGKVYIVGEYNWTDVYWQRWLWFSTALPAILALLLLFLPKKWFPIVLRLPFTKKPVPTKTHIKPTTVRSSVVKDNIEEDPFASSADFAMQSDDKSYPPATPTAPIQQQTQPLLHDGDRPKRTVWIKKWHISLAVFIILTPIAAGVVHIFQPSTLSGFLGAMKKESGKGRLGGHFYWSFFGRDSDCCNFIEHNDGYTLHYPGTSKEMRHRVLSIVRNAYVMNGPPVIVPEWLPEPMLEDFDGDSISQSTLPGAACPQNNLTLPINQSTSASKRWSLQRREAQRARR